MEKMHRQRLNPPHFHRQRDGDYYVHNPGNRGNINHRTVRKNYVDASRSIYKMNTVNIRRINPSLNSIYIAPTV
jgi:hypothetical protein